MLVAELKLYGVKYKEHKLVVLHEEVLPVSDIRQLQEYKVLMIQLGCYN